MIVKYRLSQNKTQERDARNIRKCTHECYPGVNFTADVSHRPTGPDSTAQDQIYYNNGVWETIDVMFERHRQKMLAEAYARDKAKKLAEGIQLDLF